MEESRKRALQTLACKNRIGIIDGVHGAKSGHPGGSLSVVDTLTYLYEEVMRVDPANPGWAERDRFVLSKGHCAPALYAVLAQKGFFPEDELLKLRHMDAMLQGHPNMNDTPGVDMSTGSLGQGFSVACGMALSAKLSEKDWRVYTVLGDGELEEGIVWEAAMFAGFRHLDNLTAVVDYNGLQIDGRLSEVCSPEPIPQKFAAFNWNVLEIDGHDFDQIEDAFARARQEQGRPTVIVQKTVKGKGVSFMEDSVAWHGTAPNDEQYEAAAAELRQKLNALEGR